MSRLGYYISDEQIYQHYFGDFEVGVKYTSPFRDDPAPSFAFKYFGKNLVWKDFGKVTPGRRDGIGFVMYLLNLDRKSATRHIWKELILDQSVDIRPIKVDKPIAIPYEYSFTDIQEFEMEYWDQLYFTKSFLKLFDVYSLTSLRRVGKKIWGSEVGNPVFLYLFGGKAFKAYRPLGGKDRFRGQFNGSVLEGYNQLPNRGKDLLINSSLKDTMTCRKSGYFGLGPTSENSFKTLMSKAKELNNRFDNIKVLFDNDRAGIEAAGKIEREIGWKSINFPKNYPKDPSDLVVKTKTYLYLNEYLKKNV